MSLIAKTGAMSVLILLGLLAGFFFSFSFVVMPGLDQTDPVSAIEAMQGINRAVRNPVFFVPFFLTPVFAALFAAMFWMNSQRKNAALILVAGLIYLSGGMALTVGYHIPLNEALALVDAKSTSQSAAQVWNTYSTAWTPLNTVRTVVCALAMIPAALALGS